MVLVKEGLRRGYLYILWARSGHEERTPLSILWLAIGMTWGGNRYRGVDDTHELINILYGAKHSRKMGRF